MENITAIIIVGVYTAIYVIVFFVQQSQINKLKDINSSMKSFMDIFKIDEVKKYVELKHENIIMEAEKYVKLRHEKMMIEIDKILHNDKKMREITTELLEEKVKEITKSYKEQLGEEHFELLIFAINVVRYFPIDKREQLLSTKFPKTKQIIINMLDKIKE